MEPNCVCDLGHRVFGCCGRYFNRLCLRCLLSHDVNCDIVQIRITNLENQIHNPYAVEMLKSIKEKHWAFYRDAINSVVDDNGYLEDKDLE